MHFVDEPSGSYMEIIKSGPHVKLKSNSIEATSDALFTVICTKSLQAYTNDFHDSAATMYKYHGHRDGNYIRTRVRCWTTNVISALFIGSQTLNKISAYFGSSNTRMTLSPRRNIFEITRIFSTRRFFPLSSLRTSDHNSLTSCKTCFHAHTQN